MGGEYLPISKLFSVEKGQLQSSKCIPGEYDFITAAEDWKTHNEYEHDCEALVFAAAASGSLGRTHYVNGKFISSDLCYILKPKDEKKYPINLSFYHFVFNSLRSTIVAATKSGTSKESINQKNFKKYELPYFDIEQQTNWVEKLRHSQNKTNLFASELSHQTDLLQKLRQRILQEAIEGKLTADWRDQNPNEEPASELLKRIHAEKAQLITERKIRKGKKQSANRLSNDISIPQEWVFPDLDDICQYVTDGTHQTPTYTKKGRIFLSAQNVKPFRFMPENHQFVSEDAYQEYTKNKKIEKGDLLLGRVGAGIGETAVVDKDIECAIYVSLGLIKTFKSFIDSDYLAIVFNSPYGVIYAKGNISSSSAAGNYNLGRIRSFPIPLPPLAEQKAIVAKVGKLLSLCDQLESEINTNQESVEKLMQAILREAFAHSR